jgi:SAM-dependent methyltransferase
METMRGRKIPANADQAAGEHRVRYAALFDAELSRHNAHLRAATGIGPRERVLDVGCGTGESTRDAARAAAAGSVVGVDLSRPLLERARRLTDEQGLRNVAYVQADAQVHRFPPGSFDVCVSRFGVMFFADPVAAFTTIGRALRPGGRLVLLVWQGQDRNEWSGAVLRSLSTGPAADPPTPSGSPPPPSTGPAGGPRPGPAGGPGQHPFSLADPAATRDILTESGFTDVAFTEVHEPVYYGPDVATARDFVLGLRDVRDVLAGLDAVSAGRALTRLSATLAAHETSDGVLFDSRAWIVTARRPDTL